MMINWSDVITWIEWSRDIMEELWSVWLRLAMNTCSLGSYGEASIYTRLHMADYEEGGTFIWKEQTHRHSICFSTQYVFFSLACSSICKPLWLKCSRSNQNFSQKSIFGWSIQKWWADIPKMMIMEKRGGGRKQRKKHVHEQHKKKVKTVTSRRNVIAWG